MAKTNHFIHNNVLIQYNKTSLYFTFATWHNILSIHKIMNLLSDCVMCHTICPLEFSVNIFGANIHPQIEILTLIVGRLYYLTPLEIPLFSAALDYIA